MALFAGLDAELTLLHAVAQGVLLTDGGFGCLADLQGIPVRQHDGHGPGDPIHLQLFELIRFKGIYAVRRICILKILEILGKIGDCRIVLFFTKERVVQASRQKKAYAQAEHQAQAHAQNDPSGFAHDSFLRSHRVGIPTKTHFLLVYDQFGKKAILYHGFLPQAIAFQGRI